MVATDVIQNYGRILADPDQPLKRRFRALFALKALNGPEAVEAISKCFNDPSALLKHELAYCLGQMGHPSAIPSLEKVLQDVKQEPMVRHEAGEALGAIGNPACLALLERMSQDPVIEVAETCQLAVKRIRWVSKEGGHAKNVYSSTDPTPATSDVVSVGDLKLILTDETRTLWDRYRAMFKLRDLNTEESIKALAQGLRCEDSALFRHEVAFVLGQLQSPHAVPELIERLEKSAENGMVRHECAEALGAIGDHVCKEVLEKFRKDPERVVRESCEVALDIVEYNENENQLQYAM